MECGHSLGYPAHASNLLQYQARTGSAGARPAINEGSLSCWLKSWLTSNETSIIEMLERNGNAAFAVEVTYAVADSTASRVFLSRNISILGTARTLDEVGTILTADKLYGSRRKVVFSGGRMELQHTYLVGQRV
ncbi:hypothetical protein C5748_23235 [Phyllobacterium phragmitis]|uniref:Uncharacterized protein n=2 Tax=Phyllobacterium phragmitis TaxID=2670329 RepID=A0A2S9IKX4_9HYPH|nr:hypothetical protein C5748_23235 [Phyllobacterium phragmitis]